jgi:hypothetical protein
MGATTRHGLNSNTEGRRFKEDADTVEEGFKKAPSMSGLKKTPPMSGYEVAAVEGGGKSSASRTHMSGGGFGCWQRRKIFGESDCRWNWNDLLVFEKISLELSKILNTLSSLSSAEAIPPDTNEVQDKTAVSEVYLCGSEEIGPTPP